METASQIYSRLWAERYAPEAEAAKTEEATRRAEAFVDGPRAVGPYRLRLLTAQDLLHCEGYENPLTAGTEAALQLATPSHLWWFAWNFRADLEAEPARLAARHARALAHRARGWRGLLRSSAPAAGIDYPELARAAWIARQATRHLDLATGKPTPAYFADLAAILDFVEQHFADSGHSARLDPKTGRPRPAKDTGTHWLSGLVIRLATATGWTEPAILALPLPRLWQYLRRLDLQDDPQALIPNAEKKLRARCAAELNVILAEQARIHATTTAPARN